jgi:hypothetical protein
MQFQRALRRSAFAIVTAFSLAALATPASATTILFVGNSFTYGDPAGGAPIVQNYKPGSVTDLNGSRIGGVPALFKAFTVEAGLNYDVSLETSPGKGLDWHYDNRLSTIAKPFDVVVLQSYSTLDASKPGDPATLIKYSGLLAQAFHDQNPNVDIRLDATWSRADQTYKPGGAWYGQSIYQMALDVRSGYDKADFASSLISDVIPVGQAPGDRQRPGRRESVQRHRRGQDQPVGAGRLPRQPLRLLPRGADHVRQHHRPRPAFAGRERTGGPGPRHQPGNRRLAAGACLGPAGGRSAGTGHGGHVPDHGRPDGLGAQA